MYAIDRKEALQYLSNFDFRAFFTELMGWNAAHGSPSVKSVDLQQFRFTTIAEKKGYTVLLCDGIPPYPIRARLDRFISRDHFEHIIIFADKQAKRQVWQVSIREKGQPVKLREVVYRAGQKADDLLSKLQQISVPLDKEESIHLSDLTTAARSAFDVEKVTKKFFKQFELEHKGFLKFLKGIPDGVKPWYVSVLINRLMFLYFMQSKSFLDGNPKYLTDKLQGSKARKKQTSDTFYRDFLCPLFFEGFALKVSDRSPAVRAMLGDIPYLNGGLFQKHPIELAAEADGNTIVIPDAAFEQLFAFFDKWTWHLDPDESTEGDEIDPDVLGYIFEKYINQKQMGAYYTKEDITGHIAQNTVIPFLFDTARKGCANAFEPAGAVWRMLRDDPNRYIYAAMRRGNEATTSQACLEIPAEIAAGLSDVSKRGGWNRAIPADLEEFALPTETWREFIARRRRYDEIVARIGAGEVHEVNDLITLNLDIRQLALDAIQIAGSEDLVESLYKAIESITILDPTCGSGAFLFAALELLQPLYEACLLRMREFVDEAQAEAASKGRELHFNRFAHFRKTLEAADRHVNPEYFILKTIIVQNLYGVDIMEEATEICKLRLFLKLVAQIDVKDKGKIEPLPDIDFNIRAGNTLVGYARLADLRGGQGDLYWQEQISQIETDSKDLATHVHAFRLQQTELGGSVTVSDKAELRQKFVTVEDKLDGLLALQYRVKKPAFPQWKKSTRPFHWFCDFFSIIDRGGFDVIIGNPPYVEIAKLKKAYDIHGFASTVTGNLYGPIVEQSYRLLSKKGRFGMIIPMSFSCTERMREVRDVVEGQSSKVWVSHFSGDAHPSKLFEGVKFRLDILIAAAGQGSVIYSSPYMKWFAEARTSLFPQIRYSNVQVPARHLSLIPKLETEIAPILLKLFAKRSLEPSLGRDSKVIYVHRVMTMFIKCFDFVPYFKNESDGEKKSDDYKPFTFRSDQEAEAALAVLNSTTFFLYFLTMGDCFHCGRDYVLSFPAGLSDLPQHSKGELSRLGSALMSDMKRNAVRKRAVSEKTGAVEYDEFWPRHSKSIIDQIDGVLGKHYGFTNEELDFIINYDVKYRMGASSLDEVEVDA